MLYKLHFVEHIENAKAVSYLPQQFEHFPCLLHPLLPEQPLDLPDPRHPPDVRALVGPPQHPRQLVGPEHQGGEQEVSAATFLALRAQITSLAPSFCQFALKVQTSLSGQLGAHDGEDDDGDDGPSS